MVGVYAHYWKEIWQYIPIKWKQLEGLNYSNKTPNYSQGAALNSSASRALSKVSELTSTITFSSSSRLKVIYVSLRTSEAF